MRNEHRQGTPLSSRKPGRAPAHDAASPTNAAHPARRAPAARGPPTAVRLGPCCWCLQPPGASSSTAARGLKLQQREGGGWSSRASARAAWSSPGDSARARRRLDVAAPALPAPAGGLPSRARVPDKACGRAQTRREGGRLPRPTAAVGRSPPSPLFVSPCQLPASCFLPLPASLSAAAWPDRQVTDSRAGPMGLPWLPACRRWQGGRRIGVTVCTPLGRRRLAICGVGGAGHGAAARRFRSRQEVGGHGGRSSAMHAGAAPAEGTGRGATQQPAAPPAAAAGAGARGAHSSGWGRCSPWRGSGPARCGRPWPGTAGGTPRPSRSCGSAQLIRLIRAY